MKYRNRVRSRISNLKDPKNPGLRRNVLCGAIEPSLIARMTAEVGSGVCGAAARGSLPCCLCGAQALGLGLVLSQHLPVPPQC